MVLGGFRSFHVLVTTFQKYLLIYRESFEKSLKIR